MQRNTIVNPIYSLGGPNPRMALAWLPSALHLVLGKRPPCMLICDAKSEHTGGLQGVQGARPQTWEGSAVAAWVKGEVSCCSLISGRDCESPAEPVQPEEALLCRTQHRLACTDPGACRHGGRHHKA